MNTIPKPQPKQPQNPPQELQPQPQEEKQPSPPIAKQEKSPIVVEVNSIFSVAPKEVLLGKQEIKKMNETFTLQLAKEGTGMDTSYFSFLVDEIIVSIQKILRSSMDTSLCIFSSQCTADLYPLMTCIIYFCITLLYIFSFFSLQELCSLSMVCKDWLRLSGDASLWKTLFSQYFPGTEFSARSLQGWKHVFAVEQNFLLQGLVCFHTKVSFKDAVLGIPINFSTNPRYGQNQAY